MATAKPKSSSKAKASSKTKSTSRRKTTRAAARARTTARAKTATKSKHRWSAKVMERSDALDPKENIFKNSDPKKIATSLKRSAEHSHRRKGTPYQSAMSMLDFYINRAGRNLGATRKKNLEAAKGALREQFHR